MFGDLRGGRDGHPRRRAPHASACAAGGTEWALFALGLVLLESGHAYRVTHLQHHRTFPERRTTRRGTRRSSASSARSATGRSSWSGCGAGRTARCRPGRPGLAGRRGGVPIAGGGRRGRCCGRSTPALLVYAVMAIVGSWVYPLLTVYLPHHDYGDTPLTQTRTLRGRLLPGGVPGADLPPRAPPVPAGAQPPAARAGPPARPVPAAGRRHGRDGCSRLTVSPCGNRGPGTDPAEPQSRRWPSRATRARPRGHRARRRVRARASSTTTSPTWTTCSARRCGSPATNGWRGTAAERSA